MRIASGYGLVRQKHNANHLYAHRLSWEAHNGPIPEGQYVCHTCDNPPCVRPDHLFLGTIQDNLADMVAKDRQQSRLNRDAVQDIRNRYKKYARGDATLQALADKYGVTMSGIWHVVHRTSWSHLP